MKNKFVTILIIIGILVLAGVAIFTALKLFQARRETVVPTAPESRPQAQVTEGQCRVAFMNRNQTYPGEEWYVTKNLVESALPAGGQLIYIDSNVIIDNSLLSDADVLFVSEKGGTTFGELSTGELDVIKTAYQNGMNVVAVGDNGNWVHGDASHTTRQVVNYLAAGTINYQDQTKLVTETAFTLSSPLSFLDGRSGSTVGGDANSPGIVSVSGDTECLYTLDTVNSSDFGAAIGPTCLFAFRPSSGSRGFLIAEGNKGRTMEMDVASLITNSGDCAPVEPTPTPTTQCSDSIDNDGDGKIDCTQNNSDPGCYPDGNGGGTCNPDDDDETDTPSQCSLSFSIAKASPTPTASTTPTPTPTPKTTATPTATPTASATPAPELPNAGITTPALVGLSLGTIILIFSLVLAL